MTASPKAIFVPFDEPSECGAAPGVSDLPHLPALARALATTLGSADPPEACIVVRQHPEPALALLGFFPSDYAQRLARLWGHLRQVQRGLRHVGYEQAEKDAQVLAEKLTRRIGQDTLAEARFVAIPRGGLIVLGMLSYYLDLKPHQLQNNRHSDAPLVIVDDCSLSGARFRETLQRQADTPEVIFAHLYSSPALRQAIEEAEPRVSACIGARDLNDRAPEVYGDEYPAWRARWEERSNGQTYWNGLPERVGFAWSEPDTNLWNNSDGHAEQGWRVLPPEQCLKNRIAFENGPSVFILPQSPGPLRPAPEVVFGPVDDHILIARAGIEHCFDLQGTAAAMWNALVEQGSVEAACETLAPRYEVNSDRLRSDLEQFVDQLLENELLVRDILPDQKSQVNAA